MYTRRELTSFLKFAFRCIEGNPTAHSFAQHAMFKRKGNLQYTRLRAPALRWQGQKCTQFSAWRRSAESAAQVFVPHTERMPASFILLVTIVAAFCQLPVSISQVPDVSDPCASSGKHRKKKIICSSPPIIWYLSCLCTFTIATQLHEGDAAYFPTFDYSTGSSWQAENASEGEGEERRKRAATSLNNRLWPDGVIYYVISNLYTGILETVLYAMQTQLLINFLLD